MFLLVLSIKTGLHVKVPFNKKFSHTTSSTIASSDKKQVHLLWEKSLYFSQITKNLAPTGQKDMSNHGSRESLTSLFPQQKHVMTLLPLSLFLTSKKRKLYTSHITARISCILKMPLLLLLPVLTLLWKKLDCQNSSAF